MSLQVPSGLITSVSGGGLVSGTTLPLFSYPIPMVLVGANGASASGNHSITDFSGALNVNISGGTVSANISGQTVVSNVSGNVVGVSSGGIIPVQVVSGNIDVVSGNVQIFGSGYAAFTMLSGNVGVSGMVQSGAWVQPVQLVAFDYSGLAYYPVGTGDSGRATIVVEIGSNSAAGAGNRASIFAGATAANTGISTTPLLVTASVPYLLTALTTINGMRDIQGSSGGAIGVTAVQTVGYSYSHIAGAAAITNIKSGAAFLHTININDYTSGQGFTVYDSASGVGGNVIAAPNPFAGGLTPTDLPPSSLLFDILVTSGLVVSTSGSGWDITVTWRTATS